MRVERGQHAVDRGLDQGLGLDLLDILRADALEDVAEKIELLVDIARPVTLLRQKGRGHLRGDHGACQDADCGGHQEFSHVSLFLVGCEPRRGGPPVN